MIIPYDKPNENSLKDLLVVDLSLRIYCEHVNMIMLCSFIKIVPVLQFTQKCVYKLGEL